MSEPNIERIELARRLAVEGQTRQQAAQALGIKYSTLANWARKHRIKFLRQHKRDAECIEKLRALAAQGCTLRQAADATRIIYGTLVAWQTNIGSASEMC
jgi:transposase-like protein